MTDALLGRVFNDRFRITRLIARGGMGKVYLATQEPLGRRVALKVLNPSYTAEASIDFHKRFFFEAATAAQLTHPNSVTLFDYGCSDDNIYYMAMEYLEGDSLRHALARARWFTPLRAVRIAMQVCRALREAHGLGVIHRDLKPANIFLLHHGDVHDFVKVLDFGLVKKIIDPDHSLTQTGLFLGSPGYMSPEQIRGEAVDTRGDVYALGAVLYEMLVGQAPFPRTNGLETMAAHVHEAVPSFAEAQAPQSIPANLEALVMTALSKSPPARFASMEAMLQALKRIESQLVLAEMAASRTAEEIEESGWAVVTSTGILARPRRPSFDVSPDAPTLGLRAGDDPLATVAIHAADTIIAPAPTVITQRPPTAQNPLRLRGREAVRDTEMLERSMLVRRPRRAWRMGRWSAALIAFLCFWHVPADGARMQIPQALRPLVLELVSTPAGAAVYSGESLLCANTPCTITWSDAPRHEPFVVRFVLRGHEELVMGRILHGDRFRLRAQLAVADKST